MKRGYSKLLYNQRNKDETIISVIKRLFGEHITSRLVRTQNRELSFRCIAYNTHRLTNLTIITWFSTEPSPVLLVIYNYGNRGIIVETFCICYHHFTSIIIKQFTDNFDNFLPLPQLIIVICYNFVNHSIKICQNIQITIWTSFDISYSTLKISCKQWF